MSALTALEANATTQASATTQTSGNIPPPPPNTRAQVAADGDNHPRRVLTIAQQKLIDEFRLAYNILPEHVSFDGKSDTPIFHYEALSTLAGVLLNFSALSVTPSRVEENFALSEAALTLASGRIVSNFGYSGKGDVLATGEKVADTQTMINVSRANALRAVLRMIGFDPLRAHQARLKEESIKAAEPPLDPREKGSNLVGRHALDPRTRDLRQIHALARELEFIRGDDRDEYTYQIGIYFPGRASAKELNEAERAQLIAIFCGLLKARTHAQSHGHLPTPGL